MTSIKKIRIGIISLGCPKNTADTENILSLLISKLPNLELSSPENADIVLINTCGFLKAARNEVYENIEEFEKKRVVILGCLAGSFTREDMQKYPQIYAVATEVNYKKLPQILNSITKNKKSYEVAKEPLKFIKTFGKSLITPKSYAYIKIAEGCNNRCSYCLIPKLKGRFRSRPMNEIIIEAKSLIKDGVKELVLVAQDCGAYGSDLGEAKSTSNTNPRSNMKKTTLSLLLKKLVKIPGDFWVRVLYVYPERITDELLETMASNPKICRYLDIPLQHGDDEILKKMNRFSNTKKVLERIENIRKKVPGITLRTTFITGFPGEKTENFEHLLIFMKEINFDHVGVFEYSREPGTLAYDMDIQISSATKKLRKEKAMALQQKISLANNKKLIGQTITALIEKYDSNAGKNGEGIYIARSHRFAPEIDGEIIIKVSKKSSKKLPLNTFQKIEITGATEYDLKSQI